MNAFRLIPAALCLSLVLLPSQDKLRAEEAADLFDCKNCHVMKIRDFKGRRATPVTPVEEYPEEPSGVQDGASTSRMCFSCHDGFVMDSRDVWKNGKNHGHRIGMKPSDQIAVPELGGDPVFPMNDDDNMYCGTCHSAHLSEADDAPGKVKPFLRASAEGELCLACHEDKAAIDGSGHDKGKRRSQDFEQRGTCGTCHAAHRSELPVMWSRSQGEGNLTVNTFCRSCHDDEPNPAEHPTEVVAWSQAIRGTIRTKTPGEMPVFDDNARHARVGNIGCATCHNVHRERAEGRPEHLKGLHLRLPEFVEPLCADCHGTDSLFKYKFFHSPASR
jgi:predicted CXXCH cytochrome family protein